MRKNNLWSIAFIVLGFFLSATGIAVSQNQGTQSPVTSHQRIFYRAISATAEVDTVTSDSLAPVKILREPAFTAGDSNEVFWEPLPDTVYVIIDGNGMPDTLAIPIDDKSYDPSIYIYVDTNKAALGNINKSPDVKVDPRAISTIINNQSRTDHFVYYYPRFVFVYGNAIYKSTGKIDSSYQDGKPPTVASIRAVVPVASQGNNGWIKAHDFDVHYYGLTDTSGLDSAFLSKNGAILDVHDLSKYNRNAFESPSTTIRLDSFFISQSVPGDGEYVYTLGACDGAYTPGSHGAGTNIEPLWKIKGNCAVVLASDTIRIDTQPPSIDWSAVKDVYSSADMKNGVIQIPVKLYDALSGIDVDSLSAKFTPPLDKMISVDSKLDTFFITLRVQNVQTDTVSTLDISIADSAGNVASFAKKISFIVEAPRLTSFRMADLDLDKSICLKPDSNFTNSTTVQLDGFVVSGNKTVDSLRIIGADSSVVLAYPDNGVLFFDIANVINDIHSKDKLNIKINAIDSLGNEQTNGPTRSIFFDNEISAINVTVRDVNSVDTDPRNGAYPGWTNSQSVVALITSLDADLFAIEKIVPDSGCLDASSLEFADMIPLPNNQKYTFTFQLGDSAGNATPPASFEIEYDDQIYQPDSSDFTAAYRSTIPGSGSENDSVYIIFNRPEQAPDLSRMVVNKVLYSEIQDNRVTVPLDGGDFTVSLVDLAGNESVPVPVGIDTTTPVIEAISLKDLNDSRWTSAAGFSDSLVVTLESVVSNDVDSMNIAGDVDAVLLDDGWLELPGTVAYGSRLTIRFDTAQSLESLTASFMVRDIAGNWSDTASESIVYLTQDIAVKIDAPDILTLAEFDIPSDSLYILPTYVNGDYPEYFRSIVTASDSSLTQDTVWTDFDLDSCEQTAEGYLCHIPFKIWQDGIRFVAVIDSAGNISNIDNVYFDIQVAPDVSLTLFDRSEFPAFDSPSSILPEDWKRSDSLFTDEATIVALTHLKSGDWESIRIAPLQRLSDAPWAAVASSDSSYDLRAVSLPEGLSNLETVTLSVEVKNKAGLTDSDSCAVVFDREPPSWTSFREVENRTVVSDTLFHFAYDDEDTSPGELAGIIIGDKYPGSTTSDNIRWQYIPIDEKNIFNLANIRGEHVLTAFLVDKADIDQNRWNKSMRIDQNDLGAFNHTSDSLSYPVRLNPVEVSNFPNPFDPENGGGTSLIFPLSGPSRVRISILDPFGNLVNTWETPGSGIEGLNSGPSNKLYWNGRNGENKIVANGGYICIIEALDTGEKYVRKIAVFKKAQ